MVACPRFGLSVETEKGRAHYYTSTTPGSSTGLRSTLYQSQLLYKWNSELLAGHRNNA